LARRESQKFFIGIDPNVRPLAKISEKIYRRTGKGGAPNVVFLQAAVEELPDELTGIADEVHVQFPWGSLFKAVATGDELILKSLRRLCRREARLEVLIGLDPTRDAAELERLGLPELSTEHLERELVPAYEANGFAIADYGMLSSWEWPEIESSWARKLRHSATRVLIYLHAVSNKP
jgi:16S rRNA (adenine(1408)-N(1))-methyltransferase